MLTSTPTSAISCEPSAHRADRDAISSRLMRYRDQNGQDWVDISNMLTMHPEARRKVVRLLGEIVARPDI
jgi:hypothetical protein